MDDAKKVAILDQIERDVWVTLDEHKQAVHFEYWVAALQAIFHCSAIRAALERRMTFAERRAAQGKPPIAGTIDDIEKGKG